MAQTSVIAKNIGVTSPAGLLLNDISFSLNEGEHLLITATSGSGKTTLANAIAGRIFYKASIQLKSALPSIICERLNKTLIYVSHYENEIPGCVDKVMLLETVRKKNIQSM